jgi:hypothetical protein
MTRNIRRTIAALFLLATCITVGTANANVPNFSIPPCISLGSADSPSAWTHPYCTMELNSSTTQGFTVPLPIALSVSADGVFPNPSSTIYLEVNGYGWAGYTNTSYNHVCVYLFGIAGDGQSYYGGDGPECNSPAFTDDFSLDQYESGGVSLPSGGFAYSYIEVTGVVTIGSIQASSSHS